MAEVHTSAFLVERLASKDFSVLAKVEEGFMPVCDKSIVVVAKKNTEIIGRLLLVSPAHVEGAWVRDDFRNGFVLARMMEKLEEEAKREGLSKLMAYGNPINEDYLERLYFTRIPLTVWEKYL
jgi:N-acetylglutamate synthase-like GNAT family acetyltransferase